MPLILPYRGKTPVIADDAFIAPNAVVIGDVEIGPQASVWFGVVLRGDIGPIRIGARTNLQEGVIVHLDADAPTVIGNDVTVGHGAIIHGCVIEDGAQIGMGAVVLSRARIGSGSMIAAGALVTEGAEIPDRAVAMGIPAKARREVSEEEYQRLIERAGHYASRGAEYRALIAEH